MIKHAFLVFRTYLDLFIDYIFSLYWEAKRTPLPNLEKKHIILKDDAVTIAAKIRNRQLKSEDLVQMCIERIKIVNPILNAVTDERFEEALEEAREIDRMLDEGLSEEYLKKKPFLGVPFTAKESHAVKGLLHTLGIKARAHVRAHEDAECVRLMRAAGALPLAVTNVPEINKWCETRNMVFGQTNNPYHTGRTPGGSSGGEAALMAAMATPISLCSDIGGSTRMPAFYCGLFGINPTAGYTSLKGSALRSGKDDTMASIGFVSRHNCDLAALTKVILADKAAELDLDRPVDLKTIKYYYLDTAQDLRVSPIQPELREAMDKVISQLSEEASSARRYQHAGLDHMYALWRHAMTREADVFGRLLTNNQGEASAVLELLRKLTGQSDYTWAAVLKLLDDQVLPRVNADWADRLTAALREDLLKTLGTDGVLLSASAPQPAPYHAAPLLRPFNFAYWGIFNVLRFPAVQVPLGLNSEGIPLGIQVVAAPAQEALCLAVAEHLARTFGGYVPPCKIIDT